MAGNEPSEVAQHQITTGLADSAEIEFTADRKSCEGSVQRGSVIPHMHQRNHCGCGLESML